VYLEKKGEGQKILRLAVSWGVCAGGMAQ
jgi:hypothetical protein